MGLGGSLRLPRRIPRPEIRAEGERRGFDGEGLEDFAVIVAGIDDIYCAQVARHEGEQAKAAAARNRNR